jgi:predicted DNA-binding transcriptional regulator AlpA
MTAQETMRILKKLDEVIESQQRTNSIIIRALGEGGATIGVQDVADIMGWGRQTVYNHSRAGSPEPLPRPIRKGKWLLSDIIDWKNNRGLDANQRLIVLRDKTKKQKAA